MKKSILVLSLSLACALGIHAQTAETRATGDASSQSSAAVNGAAKSINLDSGTRVSGQLQNAVDVRNAKVGDQVVLKTTQAIKSGGRTVVGKGAKLIGHVTEVSQKTKGESQSRVGILFDRLEQGSLAMPITATISSITSGSANVRRNDEDVFGTSAAGSTRANSSTGSSARTSSGGNGGLLGGTSGVLSSTTATVGDAVGSTTSAVGSTVNSTTSVAGNAASGVGGTLGRIQISESSSTSVEGSSVLSLQGGNLRLDKGTNFNLVLTQSASAGTSKNQ
jgi:hypothetical protein